MLGEEKKKIIWSISTTIFIQTSSSSLFSSTNLSLRLVTMEIGTISLAEPGIK